MKKLLYLFLLVSLFSCHPVDRVMRRGDRLLSDYKALPPYEKLPIRVLSWQQALCLMEKNNIELREARQQLEEARYQEQKIWHEWIPGVNFGQYYNRGLFKGGSAVAEDRSQVTFNVIFNFPSLMRIPVRKYTTALAEFKAEKDIEMKQRELTARLYQQFCEEKSRLQAEEREAGMMQVEKNRRQQVQAERDAWLRTAALLNDYSARWKLLGDGLPQLSPADYNEVLDAPSELTIIRMALQTEAAHLQQIGVLMEFWPQVQINFYSPTLFNSTGGQLNGFLKNGKDTRINMDTFVSLDTRRETMRAYRNSKENQEMLLQQLRQKMWEYKEKVVSIRNSWQEYENWRCAMQAYCEFRARQGGETAAEVVKYHADSMQVRMEMQEQEKLNTERVCSLIQEYGLPPFKEKTVSAD